MMKEKLQVFHTLHPNFFDDEFFSCNCETALAHFLPHKTNDEEEESDPNMSQLTENEDSAAPPKTHP